MEGINIEFAPVLTPSAKEFANFREYIEKIENKYSKQYGMVKVKAPRSWVPRKQDYEQSIQKDQIPQPIEQNAYGKGGIYEMLHIVQKSISMKEYRKRAQQFDNVTDNLSIEQVESLFYKNIAFSPPVYGADARNTLFDAGIPWNLGELDCILNDGLETLIQGVNQPFLYTGAWKTMFAWHKEDADLGAINYLHLGKPKFWYAIAPDDQHYLEKIASNNFADNFNKCSEFLRHKTTVINPYIIKKKFPEIKLHKMIQNPREFMIVFGGAYHHGFNFGFNVAEAVNYGTKNWLARFSYAKSCKCLQDQVKINPVQFYDNMIQKFPEYKKDPLFKSFASQLKQQGYLLPQDIQKQQPQKNIQQKQNKQIKNVKKPQNNDKKIVKVKLSKKIQQDFIKQQKNNKKTKAQDTEDQEETKQKQEKLPIVNKKIQKKQTLKKTENKIKVDNSNNNQSRAFKNKPTNLSVRRSVDSKLQHAYQIKDCLQCDNCSKWRIINNKKQEQICLQKRSFYCKDIDIKCTQPQNNEQIQELI